MQAFFFFPHKYFACKMHANHFFSTVWPVYQDLCDEINAALTVSLYIAGTWETENIRQKWEWIYIFQEIMKGKTQKK